MTTFLRSTRNLKDVDNVEKARFNLGIGDMSLQDSNNVLITGGSISVSNFMLDNGNAVDGAYLVSTDEYGTIDWYLPLVKDWITEDQSQILLSSFCNDAVFVRTDSLCNVAFTGNYEDLLNKPTSLTDFFNDGFFLEVNNNLSEFSNNLNEVHSNLGLGPLAFQDNFYITVSNLSVISEFRFTPKESIFSEGMFLKLGESNLAEWGNLPVSSEGSPGLIELTNNHLENDKFKAPSAYALSNAYEILDSKIAQISEEDFINNIISFGLLLNSSNLADLNDIPESRLNLGIGSLALQNSNNVTINNLVINNNFTFLNNPIEKGFLSSDSSGNIEIINLPTANFSTEGIVLLTNDINSINFNSVPTSETVLNNHKELLSNIETLSNSVPRLIRDLEDVDEYLLLIDALKGIDASAARSNLELHTVSYTGVYGDLINTPSNLSDFVNEPQYLLASSNLEDVFNVTDTRSNLGLGTISLQDSNDVNILNGDATFSTLTVNNLFSFKDNYNENDIEYKYLKAYNNEGDARWEELPKATQNIYGTVQLSHDILTEDTTKAASATMVFKVFNLLTGRINSLQTRFDNWLTSM